MTGPLAIVSTRRIVAVACLAWTALTAAAADPTASVASPNGDIRVTLTLNERAEPHYDVSFRGEQVIAPSRLGLRFRAQHGFDRGMRIVSTGQRRRDTRWRQPWGEREVVRDHCNEMLVALAADEPVARAINVRVRAYNDGVGLRYELPRQARYAQVDIVDELTEFAVDEKAEAWWIPGRNWNRYEYLYRHTGVADIDRVHTPFTLRLPSGVHLSIHEAALVDYAAMTLDRQRGGIFKAYLAPWSDGIRVKTGAPFVTPWRTIQIAANAASLLNSDLILNLNEPNALGDVSWVKPGKYVGIWWAMHIRERTWSSGPRHGATTEETKRYMDFAAEHGFDGVLVEGWNTGWDGEWFFNGDLFDFTESYPDFDLAAVTDYGREKGVYLIGHHETSGNVTNYENQLADALDLYADAGVPAIKTGYVADYGGIKRVDENGVAHYEAHDGQYMVNHHLRVVREAARRRISINPHEPVKDTGLRRTYPNWVTREGARGMEFSAWGQPPNPPEHTVILPYTRLLSGPMDFTPGIFNLTFQGADSPQRVESTLARQLAYYVVIYSPLQMVADLPQNYAKHPGAFQFIVDVPADWATSRALAGEIGEFVVMTRRERDGDDWYVGAITNSEPRAVGVPLGFLDADKTYRARIYRDGDDAHWKTNPYAIAIEERNVSRNDTLELKLAAGGGAAVRLVAP